MVVAAASELRLLDIRYGGLYVCLGFIRILLMVCVKMTFFEIVRVLGNAPGFMDALGLGPNQREGPAGEGRGWTRFIFVWYEDHERSMG